MARKPKRLKFYRRGWLNHPHHHSIALFLADAETLHGTIKERVKDGQIVAPAVDYTDLEAGLTLGDCNRQITLEFNTHSRADGADIGNVQHKADTLRKLVNDFCDTVDAGLDQVRATKFASRS